MIKKIVLENWKSFRHAELYIDPLTVLIGTNASGKSNLVEAFEFLKPITSGETIDVALTRISHKKFLKSHKPYPVKARQNKGCNSLLFFVRLF